MPSATGGAARLYAESFATRFPDPLPWRRVVVHPEVGELLEGSLVSYPQRVGKRQGAAYEPRDWSVDMQGDDPHYPAQAVWVNDGDCGAEPGTDLGTSSRFTGL